MLAHQRVLFLANKSVCEYVAKLIETTTNLVNSVVCSKTQCCAGDLCFAYQQGEHCSEGMSVTASRLGNPKR